MSNNESSGGAAKGIIGVVAFLLVGLVAILASFAVVGAILAGGMFTMLGGAAGTVASDERRECASNGSGEGAVAVSGTQEQYIRTFIGIAKTMGVPERGQIIAVMTLFQESGIKNYANNGENHRGYGIEQRWLDMARLSLAMPHDAVGNDADSVGLVQQRASAGWADGDGYTADGATDGGKLAITRLLDPRWAAQAFYGGEGATPNRGLTDIAGWEDLPLGKAAQTVQGSAFPDAYNKWEERATSLVREYSNSPAIPLLSGTGGGTGTGGSSGGSTGGSSSSSLQQPLAEGTYSISSEFGPRIDPGTGENKPHNGRDYAAPEGTPIYAIGDGIVKIVDDGGGWGQYVVIDHDIDGKLYSSLYAHQPFGAPTVTQGATVKKGDRIGSVGNTGYSFGAHLHLEIWEGGFGGFGAKRIDPASFLTGAHVVEGATCGTFGG